MPQAAELAKKGTVVLTRHGKPLASINFLSGADWKSVSLANNPRFRAPIAESRRSYRKEGGISLDEVRRELKLKNRQVTKQKKKG